MVKMTVAGLRLGQKVTSTQGRDCGQNFLIVGFIDDYYVLVADGIKRSIKQPKKKSIKHLSISLWVDELIENKLSSGSQVTDEEIFSAIQRWGEKKEEGEISLG